MPPIPLPLIYAGLAGTLLALIVATATNKWERRVFFLLALRLAIGWHFLFEGMHKIHSHMVGPIENTQPFSSERYFAAAEGPLGPIVRKQAGMDYDAIIQERIAPDASKLESFVKLSPAEQAAICPKPIAEMLTKAANDNKEKADEQQSKAKAAVAKAEEESKTAKADPDAKKAEAAKKKLDDAKLKLVAANEKVRAIANEGEALKFTYARWVYGIDDDRRDAKVKYFNTDVPQSVPERLRQIGLLQKEAQAYTDHEKPSLGNGYGYDVKVASAARSDTSTAKLDLVKDADAFVTELVKYTGADAPKPEPKKIVELDKLAMWTITIVGACLMFGFLTPLACIIGAGFLLMTYLTHPPFPWYTLPPGTEGNPLFINKNIIEMLALLVIAVHPTGRWLGLDALWTLCFFDRRKKAGTVAGAAG